MVVFKKSAEFENILVELGVGNLLEAKKSADVEGGFLVMFF